MPKFLAALAVAALCSPVLLRAADRPAAAASTFAEFAQVIRTDNLPALSILAHGSSGINATNSSGNTPLHYAATYGSVRAVRALLAAGANPNARNASGATPLLYGAWNLERTRALAEKGGDVKAANKQGVTPLMVACSTHGNLATLRFLIDRGADVHAVDDFKTDALMHCADRGDAEMLSLLVANGASVRSANRAGFTALQLATAVPFQERLRILLAAGSDPNASNNFAGMVKNGPIALIHLTPLMTLVPYGTPAAVHLLLNAGARINDSDSRKMTPLMLSIATDQANPAVVKLLIAAGADVNAHDQNGESVLDWALKYRQPDILALLAAAGAKAKTVPSVPPASGTSAAQNPAEALNRAAPLLVKANTGFFREGGGCGGCHHQAAYARIHGAWKDAGSESAAKLRQPFLDAMVAAHPLIAGASPVLGDFPGDIDPGLYMLAAYSEMHVPANDTTDLLLHYIVSRQDRSGAWISLGIARPPLEDSTITRTVYAMRGLKQYAWPARQSEMDERLARAGKWLLHAKPATTYEAAERLLGLQIAGMKSSQLRSDADRIIAAQRTDGGWAQTPFLDSDAYATGMVLDILYKTGFAAADHPVYRRGVAYLLRNQYPDGSWYVRSRAPKFQPYFQSGFPFAHDQWISSAATSWALIALSRATNGSSLPQLATR